MSAMILPMCRIHCLRNRRREARVEREKEARLAQAEDDLRVLKGRAFKALWALDDRNKRNHWRESIEQMIQGST